jgi:hypothetical protein
VFYITVGILYITVGVFILMWVFLYDCGHLYMTVGILYITCFDLAVHEVFSVSNEKVTAPFDF